MDEGRTHAPTCTPRSARRGERGPFTSEIPCHSAPRAPALSGGRGRAGWEGGGWAAQNSGAAIALTFNARPETSNLCFLAGDLTWADLGAVGEGSIINAAALIPAYLRAPPPASIARCCLLMRIRLFVPHIIPRINPAQLLWLVWPAYARLSLDHNKHRVTCARAGMPPPRF